jgi:alpha-D-ribose 1-methylphosphonate 5-triphosphate synthase subunit PhnI
MKKVILFTVIFLGLFSSISFSDTYKVNVKRLDSNIYKDLNSGTIIETRYCYEYAYGEEALLKYDKNPYGDKLIFENNTVCEVKAVYK